MNEICPLDFPSLSQLSMTETRNCFALLKTNIWFFIPANAGGHRRRLGWNLW